MFYLKTLYEAFKLVPRWLKLVIAGIILVLAVGGYTKRLIHQRDDALFAADSTEAVNTHTVLLLAGKNRVYSRRVVQTELQRDSLAKALHSETRLKAALLVQLDSAVGTGTSISKDGTFVFHEYAKPYTLDANVRVHADTGSINFSIKQDPLKLGVRLECEQSSGPVHAASIVLIAPSGVTVNVDSASQSREVCSAGTSSAHTGISRTRAYTEAGLFLGGGFFVVKKFILPLFKR